LQSSRSIPRNEQRLDGSTATFPAVISGPMPRSSASNVLSPIRVSVCISGRRRSASTRSCLTTGQVEADRVAEDIGQGVDLGALSAAGAPIVRSLPAFYCDATVLGRNNGALPSPDFTPASTFRSNACCPWHGGGLQTPAPLPPNRSRLLGQTAHALAGSTPPTPVPKTERTPPASCPTRDARSPRHPTPPLRTARPPPAADRPPPDGESAPWRRDFRRPR
jgi:hypothetical protein